MTRLRTIGVWLTAVMTMAAGLPRYVCACPGRPTKSGESSIVQGCPCGSGGCCASAPSSGCCDSDRGSKRNSAPDSGRTVCKTILVAQQAQVPAAANGVSPSSELVVWAVLSPCALGWLPALAVTAPAWQLPSHAPPPDLLLLLQHFLI